MTDFKLGIVRLGRVAGKVGEPSGAAWSCLQGPGRAKAALRAEPAGQPGQAGCRAPQEAARPGPAWPGPGPAIGRCPARGAAHPVPQACPAHTCCPSLLSRRLQARPGSLPGLAPVLAPGAAAGPGCTSLGLPSRRHGGRSA